MIYKNKATDTYLNIPDNNHLDIVIDKTLYEKVNLIDGDNRLNQKYLLSLLPSDEVVFTNGEFYNLIRFNTERIPFIHIKTGNKYYLINICIECTNGQEDQLKAIYKNNDGCIFTRELSEFLEKFKRCNQ